MTTLRNSSVIGKKSVDSSGPLMNSNWHREGTITSYSSGAPGVQPSHSKSLISIRLLSKLLLGLLISKAYWPLEEERKTEQSSSGIP